MTIFRLITIMFGIYRHLYLHRVKYLKYNLKPIDGTKTKYGTKAMSLF